MSVSVPVLEGVLGSVLEVELVCVQRSDVKPRGCDNELVRYKNLYLTSSPTSTDRMQ
jgi:hypothetical protein